MKFVLSSPADLEPLSRLMTRLVGEVCWRSCLSYGAELTLHLGAKIPYAHPRMAHKQRGSWMFGARATRWTLRSDLGTFDNAAAQAEDPEANVESIQGSRVASINIELRDLTLEIVFDNSMKLTLFPDLDDPDLPFWELFTPEGTLLQAGPGAAWCHVSAIMHTEDEGPSSTASGEPNQ